MIAPLQRDEQNRQEDQVAACWRTAYVHGQAADKAKRQRRHAVAEKRFHAAAGAFDQAAALSTGSAVAQARFLANFTYGHACIERAKCDLALGDIGQAHHQLSGAFEFYSQAADVEGVPASTSAAARTHAMFSRARQASLAAEDARRRGDLKGASAGFEAAATRYGHAAQVHNTPAQLQQEAMAQAALFNGHAALLRGEQALAEHPHNLNSARTLYQQAQRHYAGVVAPDEASLTHIEQQARKWSGRVDRRLKRLTTRMGHEAERVPLARNAVAQEQAAGVPPRAAPAAAPGLAPLGTRSPVRSSRTR